ncbi:MAG: PglZ domain-containing protein [Schleiferiaceae bacterium]|jgi:DNA-binding response OmpR family regulator
MENSRILWVDDEVEALRPHILYLEGRGIQVLTATNAADALALVRSESLDGVLLDEHMPGPSGLDVLPQIKALKPALPVVMVTKSEEEGLMTDALGSQLADYLLKPVQPRQVLSTLTRILGQGALQGARSASRYQQEFRDLGVRIAEAHDWDSWTEIYRELLRWDRELAGGEAESMRAMLDHQREEANRLFTRWWSEAYPRLLHDDESPCLFSHQLLDVRVKPLLDRGEKVVMLVFDNLRLDQWQEIQSLMTGKFRVESDDLYASILPTATQYARNALLGGAMPAELAKRHPERWVRDVLDAEGGRNSHEEFYLSHWAARNGVPTPGYAKLTHATSEQRFVAKWRELRGKALVAVVVNFIDRMSHAKTDEVILRDLARDDRGFRSLTASWWTHSPLRAWVDDLAQDGTTLVVTTDHGTITVRKPVSLRGSRDLTANLRYKVGRGMEFKEKEVALVADPERLGIPPTNLGDKVLFAGEQDYFVYQSQYHHHVEKFDGSYQHGGISLEEVVVPFAVLRPRG